MKVFARFDDTSNNEIKNENNLPQEYLGYCNTAADRAVGLQTEKHQMDTLTRTIKLPQEYLR